MKKWVKERLKLLLFVLLSLLGIFILNSFLDYFLFHFSVTKYNNEIDSLFKKDINNLYVEHKYKSGKRGSIYYVSIGSSKLTVVEANNFKSIDPSMLHADSIEKVKFTDGKTYSTILWYDYPVVDAALNPKKSNFIKVLLLKPFNIEIEERKSNHFYLSGKLCSVEFSNSQVCYVIASKNPELLVLTFNNKLYLIVGETKNQSLLELINPKIL